MIIKVRMVATFGDRQGKEVEESIRKNSVLLLMCYFS